MTSALKKFSPRKIEDISLLAFIRSNDIKNETGESLDFYKYRFLIDIYSDDASLLVCMKAAQIGFTTFEILKSAHECKNYGYDIIYVLPTADDVKKFSGGKTNKIISQNPIFGTWTKDKDSVEQKQFGQNTIYYQGCVDANTEVLTTTGWKHYNEIQIGDSLPSVNIETKYVEMDTVLDMTVFETEQEVFSIKNDAVDAVVTKDHRCVISRRGNPEFEIVHAFQMKPNSRQSMPLRTNGIKSHAAFFSDAFVEVIGWVITEGSYWTARDKSHVLKKDGTINPKVYESPRVVIVQKKEVGIRLIRKALTEAGIGYFEKKRKDGCIYFQINYEYSRLIKALIPTKKLTFELVNKLSRYQMELLYDVLIAGDGHTKASGFQTFIQKDRGTIDAFQYLIALMGYGSTARFRTKLNSFSRNEIGEVSVKTSENITKYKITPFMYKGIMWCPTTRNGTIFTRRNGKVWITGQSWTERAALMITAKKLIVDEYDRCKPAIVEQYDSRLQSVSDPRKAFFSNPSTPDFGVHKYYKLSDQKKWHVKHACGKIFVLDESCIDYDQEIFKCPFCHEEISDETRRLGEWIPTAKGAWSGYWIPLWIAPWMSAKNIAEYKRTKTAEYFANFVAGLPYYGSGNKVSAHTIIGCLSPIQNAQEGRIIIGVDTGLPIHYVLSNKQGFFFYGKCSDPTTGKDPYKELEELLLRFPQSIIVADQGGDLIGIRSLQARYPGRVFMVWYRADRKGEGIIKWGTGTDYGTVVADRNRLIQLFIDEMTDKRVTFNGTESEWQEYIANWLNIYRTWEENALGVREFKWERTGPDHFCHASLYARIGLDKFQDTQAKVVGGDFLDGIPLGRMF